LSQFLRQNRITCFKYNHSIDFASYNFVGQNHNSFQSYLYLSADLDNPSLIITNRRPKQDVKHMLNTEPKEILRQRQEVYQKRQEL